MRWNLNRSRSEYLELVDAGDADVTRSLARVLLSLIDDPGEYTIDDRGGWIEIVRVEGDELERLRALVDALDI